MHKGQPATFAAALPALLRLQSRKSLRHALGCADAPHLHAVPAALAKDVADLDWNVCPFDICASPYMDLLMRVNRLSRIAPLSDWPHRYAPWLVGGLLHLRGES